MASLSTSNAAPTSEHATSPAFQKPLKLPLSPEELTSINTYLSTLTPQEILRWAVAYLPNLAQTTAFGLTGLVALDMISTLDLPQSDRPPLIFLDTLYHFPETYALVEEVKERYGAEVHVFRPYSCETVEDFEAMYGKTFWKRDEDTYDFVVKVSTDATIFLSFAQCLILQVEPARRAYDAHSINSIITGRRASQGGSRSNLQPLEVDSMGLLKLNPLFAWSFKEVEHYVNSNNVPRNKLLAQGYRSVGDWHSTSKVGEGQDERAGRWAGKVKSECGLHEDYFKMKEQAKGQRFNSS